MLCESCLHRSADAEYRREGDTGPLQALCARCASRLNAERLSPLGEIGGLLGQLFGNAGARRETPIARLAEDGEAVMRQAAEMALGRGVERMEPLELLAAIGSAPGLAQKLLLDADLTLSDLDPLLEALPRSPGQKPDRASLGSAIDATLGLALREAAELRARGIGPEHLLLGLLQAGGPEVGALLRDHGLEPAGLRQRIRETPAELVKARTGDGKLPRTLGRYTRDLVAAAKAGEIDPVIGRDEEIERAIHVLSRRTKNNPVLLGESGVGKTAIVEGLARRLADGDVPPKLRGKRILALDLAGLVAGSRYRGDFEERVQGLFKEVQRLSGQVILFMDELHTLVGAGAAEGAMDAAQLIKPLLARGGFQAIGATTLEEYRKTIEKDPALERRFQPLLVGEPSVAQTVAILHGLRATYERHHGVRIADEALEAAADLGEKYIADRRLPDKAIDLLDEACTARQLEGQRAADDVLKLEDALARAGRGTAEALALAAHLERARAAWQAVREGGEVVVGSEQIARVVARWTGIPTSKLLQEEGTRLLAMEALLHQRVIGQDEAIGAVAGAVRRARSGLKPARRPIGSFLFLGPTGVGKTELARALAEFLFQDEDAILRFDMSEFMEKHAVSRLTGAPPGYIGYEEAGQLTEAVRRKPYSVLLFDEIEKAHPDIFNLLLQILDDGRLTDAKGHAVDFKHTVVVMTSNAGSSELVEAAGADRQGPVWQAAKQAALEGLKEVFRPEFLNRIDEIIVFHPLARAEVMRIARLMLDDTARKLTAQAMTLEVDESAIAAIAAVGFDPAYGARPLRRAIQRELETPLARHLIAGDFGRGDVVRVRYHDGQFAFERVRACAGDAAATPRLP